MTESKYYLKNWKRWKRTVQLLEATKDDLKDMKKGLPVGSDTMPGGSHKAVDKKINEIIERCEEYDEVIAKYNFLISHLENAIVMLLDEDLKEACMIYANNPNSSKKQVIKAIEVGLSERTYYNRLKEGTALLDTVLNPCSNFAVKAAKNDVKCYCGE